MPDGLVGVLMRVPQAAAEQLAVRLSRARDAPNAKRSLNSPNPSAHLARVTCRETLRNEPLRKPPPSSDCSAAWMFSRSTKLLPLRLSEGQRSFHDAVVRQLSTAGAPERGQILANCSN